MQGALAHPQAACQKRGSVGRARGLRECLRGVTPPLLPGPGVPWKLHVWIESLRTSFSQSRYSVVQSLLRDFSSLKEEEYNEELVTEGLQLMFNILKTSKVSVAGQVPPHAQEACIPRARSPEPDHRPDTGTPPRTQVHTGAHQPTPTRAAWLQRAEAMHLVWAGAWPEKQFGEAVVKEQASSCQGSSRRNKRQFWAFEISLTHTPLQAG